MKCQRCDSDRVLVAMGKPSDCQIHHLRNRESEGAISIPHVVDGDYMRFRVCLNCGQMQGTWPIPPVQQLEPEPE